RRGALGRLHAAWRALRERRAADSQRTLARTSVSFGVAAILVLSFLAADRHSSLASDAAVDTPPPPIASPSVPSASALPSPSGTLARKVAPAGHPSAHPSAGQGVVATRSRAPA